MVSPLQALSRRIRILRRPVDLDQVCATIHHGCMGLPQELVDHVMDMLYDNTRALKACSLTCKAMFASTRHLIHQTLILSQENTLRILTPKEKRHYETGDPYIKFHSVSSMDERDLDVEFRFVSFMDERGLLQYVRRVHLHTKDLFTPEILLPRLHYFQLLNQVHALTIDYFYPNKWVNYHSTVFAHFYPTLTSLTLRVPHSHEWLLNFALRFPNLENLSLEWLTIYNHLEWSMTDIAPPERTPPLRGCLRLAGRGQLSTPFRKPPKGFNFRSVELYDNFPGSQAQHALNACARTLETLIIKAYPLEHNELQLTEMAVLRRLTLCTTFDNGFLDLDNLFLGMLSTIASPVFCEFALEVGGCSYPGPDSRAFMKKWSLWRDFDYLVENKFARNRDFRLIIKTSESSDWEELRKRVERGFPLLAGRGCIYLELL